MADHHYSERSEQIRGDRFDLAAETLSYFVQSQRDVPPAEQYSVLAKLRSILTDIESGQDWLRIEEEAAIAGAGSCWQREMDARRQAEEDEAAARSEILRGLREL
jgi:hypothetical protein